MGIEPMTNGLLDQRSTDWATRPFWYHNVVCRVRVLEVASSILASNTFFFFFVFFLDRESANGVW